MPPRRNPRRKAQESGSSDSDDSIEVVQTVKRPRSMPDKKVETAHDHTVIKTFSDYRPKRGGARKPSHKEEEDEDWEPPSRTDTTPRKETGRRVKKEVKTEVVPFAGEGHSLLAGSSSKEASTPASSSSTSLMSPASEPPSPVSLSSKLGPTIPTESSTKVDDGGTADKEVSKKAMNDRQKRDKMLSALEGRMKGDWKRKMTPGKLKRQYGFWAGA